MDLLITFFENKAIIVWTISDKFIVLSASKSLAAISDIFAKFKTMDLIFISVSNACKLVSFYNLCSTSTVGCVV